MFFNDLVNALLKKGQADNMTDKQFIQYELTEWLRSPARQWQLTGNRYYQYEEDILTKQRTAIGAGGALVTIHNLPNHQIMDNRYAFLVDQKVNYLLAKEMEVKAKNEAQDDTAKVIFGPEFRRTLKNIGKDAMNCGISYLFPYVEDSKLKFKRFHGYEILPFWADDEHTQLDAFARLYIQEVYEGTEKRFIPRVEWYTADGVQKFTFIGGCLEPESEGLTPYIVVNDGAGQEKGAYNWGRVPLVAFKANESELPLIKRVKSLQDALNTLYSDFCDHMQEDSRNTLLVIKGYDGQDMPELRQNLMQYGMVKVNPDDGGVETLYIEVNAENYNTIISLLKSAIIENGRGLDMKNEQMTTGSPNQMNIQSMYNDIDLDADEMELEFQAGLQQLMYFVQKVTPGIGDVDFIFDRDRMINESEIIANCKLSVGIISDETIVSNHPWVTDTQEELARVKKEKEADMALFPVGDPRLPGTGPQANTGDEK